LSGSHTAYLGPFDKKSKGLVSEPRFLDGFVDPVLLTNPDGTTPSSVVSRESPG